MKKKLLTSVIILFFSISVFAGGEAKVAYYVGGYWSDWKTEYLYLNVIESAQYRHEISSISEHGRLSHPSEYMWKLSVQSSNGTDGDWVVYNGTFEYYITDEYPDARSLLLAQEWVDPHDHNPLKGQTPCVKKTVNARIKKQSQTRYEKVLKGYSKWGTPKYEQVPYDHVTYNIYFDNVGFAISFDVSWNN